MAVWFRYPKVEKSDGHINPVLSEQKSDILLSFLYAQKSEWSLI